jgi:RHS repeat-associated protein
VHKFTGHERDAGLSSVKGTVDYMHARMCSPVTGRFLSVDPILGRTTVPQTWNRYSYARNNPVVFIDPSGMRDDRSKEDKAFLEDADVLVAVAEIITLTKLGEPQLSSRQEAGAAFGVENGDYFLDGKVETQGKVNEVNLVLQRFKEGPRKGEITSQSQKELAATMHSHPGTGEVTIDGKRAMAWGGAASKADKDQVQLTGKPLYILNAKVALLKLTPGERKATVILDGGDYREYLRRAEAAVSKKE